MEDLPDDLCRNLAGYLGGPEIMTVVKLNKAWSALGKTECFWRDLLFRDAEPSVFQSIDEVDEGVKVKAAKKIFLAHSHASLLSSAKWCAVPRNTVTRHPPSREGHLMCVLGDRVVCTGGFCDDERVHILNLKADDSEPKRWNAFSPQGQRPQFVYGATLTALDDMRAVQFGGFRAGGYSAECADVCLLTINKEHDSSCRWERILTLGPPPLPRAYTSATLIHNRYLVFIGGMGMHGCFIGEAVLDTHTWTWRSDPVSDPMVDPKPSGRHGHTTVLDGTRNRLVTFGGGSGTDLLRSGVDNTEVWELKLGDNWEEYFSESFPWAWQRLHRDENDISDPNQASTLTPSETLCLGRCHVGAKVSRNTVVFACGSGRPTSNGVLGYNLKTDTFLRPNISGPLPVPRFTAAATVTGGWLVIHGGYSTQNGDTLGDTVLLDLAPGLKRSFGALPVATNSIGHHPILDEDVDRGRRESSPNRMFEELMAAPAADRRALASQMLGRLLASGHLGGRSATILSMVANGSAVFGDEEDSNSDDDGSDDEGDDEDFAEEDDDELDVGL